MGVVSCSVLVAVPLVFVLWLWGRPLLDGRWRKPGWFVATAAFCVAAGAATWLIGAVAGPSLDPEESCHAAGTTYDYAYRSAHWRESSRWFPLHNRCNADYDLVPAWINPGLVLLVLLAAACLCAAVWLTAANQRTKKDPEKGMRRP
jgi:hypothetical protein